MYDTFEPTLSDYSIIYNSLYNFQGERSDGQTPKENILTLMATFFLISRKDNPKEDS